MRMVMSKKAFYKIIFLNQGKVYEIFAKSISQGSLFGFIEVAQIVFGEKSSLVVDPSEENLKSEFANVSRIHIPMHSVIRIDEVNKQGPAKITDAPVPVPPPIAPAGRNVHRLSACRRCGERVDLELGTVSPSGTAYTRL